MSALIGLWRGQRVIFSEETSGTYAETVSNDSDESTANLPSISANDAFTTAVDACIDYF